MSEEVENANDGTLSGLKKTIIGVITTAVMGLGTWGVTQITGGDEAPAPAAAPVINITNSNQQSQQAAGGGKTVIIKEKETVKEKAAPAPAPKKKEGDEFKEKPAEW
jgi:hypothetical protein